MTQDSIFIEDLIIDTIIGILPHERQHTQPVILDLELFVDTRSAATSEDIMDTIDYFELTERLREFVAESHYLLIEKLAASVADFLLQSYLLDRVKIKLSKPNALVHAKNVGVIIERSRHKASA